MRFMQYAVLVENTGRVMIAKDYGDYAWNGPSLRCVGYHTTLVEARKHARAIKRRTCQETGLLRTYECRS